jgi:hypothetical protein
LPNLTGVFDFNKSLKIFTFHYNSRKGRGACSILVGIPEGRRPLGRPRHRWEDNIKMALQEMGWGMNWMELAQGRDRWRAVVNAVMNLRVP